LNSVKHFERLLKSNFPKTVLLKSWEAFLMNKKPPYDSKIPQVGFRGLVGRKVYFLMISS